MKSVQNFFKENEEADCEEPEDLPPSILFEPLPLWRFCVPKPRDSGYIALWFIFWTVSLPIITEKFNADRWSWWLAGVLIAFCILSLCALGQGYLNWWLSSRHHMQQSDALFTAEHHLEVAKKRLKELGGQQQELQALRAHYDGLEKELAEIRKLAEPFLSKDPKE